MGYIDTLVFKTTCKILKSNIELTSDEVSDTIDTLISKIESVIKRDPLIIAEPLSPQSIGWFNYSYPLDKQKFKSFIMNYLDICKSYMLKPGSKYTINECIIDPLGNPISDIGNIKIDVSEVNDELLKMLKNNPNYLYKLSPRKFEEVIAEILSRKGYEVTLTSATRDGGKDIFVAQRDDLGSFLYLVECKKFAPNRPVGIDVIQRLYGVISAEDSTYGIIATTSYFTKPAKDFQQRKKFRMSLKDFDSIKQWLCDVT